MQLINNTKKQISLLTFSLQLSECNGIFDYAIWRSLLLKVKFLLYSFQMVRCTIMNIDTMWWS